MADQKSDTVNHPGHYNTGRIEVIDAIEDWKLGFNLGNCVKYVARADHKGNREEDLRKAKWYLERELAGIQPTLTAEVSSRTVAQWMMSNARMSLPMKVQETADVIGLERADGSVLIIKHRKGQIGERITREMWNKAFGGDSDVLAVLVKNGEDLLQGKKPASYVIEGLDAIRGLDERPPTDGAAARSPTVDEWIGVLPTSVTDNADVIGVQFVEDGRDGDVLIVKNTRGAIGERITRATWGKRYGDSDVRAVIVRRDRLPEIPRKQAPAWLKHLRTGGERDIREDLDADDDVVLGTIEDKVCHLLNGKSDDVFTVAQIAAQTGVDQKSLCTCLSRLLRRGVIARPARGVYCSRTRGRVGSSRG